MEELNKYIEKFEDIIKKLISLQTDETTVALGVHLCLKYMV